MTPQQVCTTTHRNGVAAASQSIPQARPATPGAPDALSFPVDRAMGISTLLAITGSTLEAVAPPASLAGRYAPAIKVAGAAGMLASAIAALTEVALIDARLARQSQGTQRPAAPGPGDDPSWSCAL